MCPWSCMCPVVFHDDITKWKHFPRYWPFVREIHRAPVNSLHKASDASFGVSFDLLLNKLLSKHWWGWWFKTQSRPIGHHSNDFALILPYQVIDIFNMLLLLYVARPHVRQLLADELSSWWRHQMETFPTLLAFYEGNPTVMGGFPS